MMIHGPLTEAANAEIPSDAQGEEGIGGETVDSKQ